MRLRFLAGILLECWVNEPGWMLLLRLKPEHALVADSAYIGKEIT